ncbi:hypothetical protein MKX08_010438 [Trichoderma sp. CBMAI-0020]|nr:hypothetical protein MKX08_010438 [Trichoderma sp. CBMAI-0020]WOD45685.1 hypothetical protein [Trichoderma atroviride]
MAVPSGSAAHQASASPCSYSQLQPPPALLEPGIVSGRLIEEPRPERPCPAASIQSPFLCCRSAVQSRDPISPPLRTTWPASLGGEACCRTGKPESLRIVAAAATTDVCQIASAAVDSASRRRLAARPSIRLPCWWLLDSRLHCSSQQAAGREALGVAPCLDRGHTTCRPYFHARDPRLNLRPVFRAGQQLAVLHLPMARTGEGAGRGIRRPA